jgi:hypothetical protein
MENESKTRTGPALRVTPVTPDREKGARVREREGRARARAKEVDPELGTRNTGGLETLSRPTGMAQPLPVTKKKRPSSNENQDGK